jgi:guanylate kinase
MARHEFEAAPSAASSPSGRRCIRNLYGTLAAPVQRVLDARQHVIMDIDVQGRCSSVRAFPQSVLDLRAAAVGEVLAERTVRRAHRTAPETVALRLRNARDELARSTTTITSWSTTI